MVSEGDVSGISDTAALMKEMDEALRLHFCVEAQFLVQFLVVILSSKT